MEWLESMRDIMWLSWVAVGVVFIVLELSLPIFILIFFAAGAFIAGVFALFDFSLTVQVTAFGVSSLVLLLLLRKKINTVFKGRTFKGYDDNEDQAIGELVEVIEAIAPHKPGRVKYSGSFWTAQSTQEFEPGEMVRIVSRAEANKSIFNVEKEGQ